MCFLFSSRRRHTRCALVTGVQTLCSSDLGLEPRIEPVPRDARAVSVAELAKHLGKLVRIFHLAERRQIERGARLLLELPDAGTELGSASCRERVCQYV